MNRLEYRYSIYPMITEIDIESDNGDFIEDMLSWLLSQVTYSEVRCTMVNQDNTEQRGFICIE